MRGNAQRRDFLALAQPGLSGSSRAGQIRVGSVTNFRRWTSAIVIRYLLQQLAAAANGAGLDAVGIHDALEQGLRQR